MDATPAKDLRQPAQWRFGSAKKRPIRLREDLNLGRWPQGQPADAWGYAKFESSTDGRPFRTAIDRPTGGLQG
jgi:hypothetical protein